MRERDRAARLGAVALACLALSGCRRAGSSGPPRVELGAGVEYVERVCETSAGAVRLRSLRYAPATAQLRVLQNPTARREAACQNRYGGRDIVALLPGVEGFRPSAFANGNFFHLLDGRFRSNGFLYSLEGARGARVMAPLQPTTNVDYRGDRLLVLDSRGAHELRIDTGECLAGACGASVVGTRWVDPAGDSALRAGGRRRTEAELVEALRGAFPTVSAALQLTPASELPDERGSVRTSAYVQCNDRHSWTCAPHPATWVCVRPTGEAAVITAESAEYEPLATALGPAGRCGTECAGLYILDGGGSAQVGYVRQGTREVVMRFAGKSDASPAPGCSTYRPVEHYLVLGAGE